MKPHRIVPLLLLALLLPALVLLGCGSKQNNPLFPVPKDPAAGAAAVPQDVLQDIARLKKIAAAGDHGVRFYSQSNSGHGPVVVPAGSVDALAAAIASAGPGGIVILAQGVHTEHSSVGISRRVSIVGETGAVLESGVTHSNDAPTVVRPALYVHDVEGVTVWNLTMKPTGTVGGTAILLENAPRTTVGWNSISDFQFSVLLQNADASTLIGNTIVVNPGWLGGDPGECDGIININGSGVRIVNNDVSGGLLNVFCCGADGYYMLNSAHGGFVGMILCRVPAGSLQLPSGAVVGAEVPGKNWLVQGNDGSNNFYTGLMVIDGANHNRLVNNAGSGNGTYDVELLGATCLFGFETPTSFDNTMVIGPHPNLTINDFGQNNTIIGGNTVTHNISAPCTAPHLAARPLFR